VLVLVIVAAVLGVTRPWRGGESDTGGGQAAPTAPASRAPLAAVLNSIAGDAQTPTEQSVAAVLQPLLTNGGLGGHVTVNVVDVSSGTQLYGSGEDEPTTPASTMKLATAISALAVRGPAYQIPTRVVAGAQPGEVVLIGGGDPTLAAGATPAYPGAAKLSDLAAQVKRALNEVAPAKVIVDSSLFTGAKASPQWDPSDVSDGQVSNITALMTDGARTDPKRSGTPAPRYGSPDLAAGRSFAKLLGLPTSAVARGSAPAGAGGAGSGAPAPAASGAASAEPGTLLGEVKSPPLVRILEAMLSSSDNVIAEMMARQVALATGRPASFDGGAMAVLDTLEKLGVPTEGAHIVDGSGLSSSDKLTPKLLTAILTIAASPDQPQLHGLFTGLPVAGYSGTLINRYRDDDSESGAGLVRAKTGTLTGVSALAGLVIDSSGRLLAFALMADQAQGGADEALDKIAAALAGRT
jgi:D-alanyl-D-alanine carboxypeptidase/D-alanyl-D-alanine-endopeptidase (penicillin-binding protein 4)